MRIDLAAALRLAVLMDWHEAVGNHFSLAVSADGKQFLMNPRWKHFSLVRASDLLLLDSGDTQTMSRPDAPDASAWCIHGRIHARVPRARCVLHVHPPYATVLATLADPRIRPIDQNTALFSTGSRSIRVQRTADQLEEGERLARVLGEHHSMIMGNHGVLVTAPTVAEAFDELYFQSARAARICSPIPPVAAISCRTSAGGTAQSWGRTASRRSRIP